jgi:hypothetical protein
MVYDLGDADACRIHHHLDVGVFCLSVDDTEGMHHRLRQERARERPGGVFKHRELLYSAGLKS